MKCKYKYIFWDNDGVLVDTERYYLQASREALGKIDIFLSDEQFTAISLSEGHSIFDLATQAGIEKTDIENLRLWRNSRYHELLKSQPLTINGSQQTLEKLFGKTNMAIVTSSRKDHFMSIHEKSGLLYYIDFFLTREDYKESKPSAEPYLKALEQSGCKKEDVLVIEDSPRGLNASKSAGLTCWVIPNQHTINLDFSAADKIIGDIREIPGLIL
jgi:HAD superfamily hydrolase (TIGR01509 family)